MLHHVSGSNAGQRAVKASRGTKAFLALVSQILELDWLISEDKHDNRVTILQLVEIQHLLIWLLSKLLTLFGAILGANQKFSKI